MRIADLLDLPPLLDVCSREKRDVPTAAELAGVQAVSTAYRLAKDWPTVKVGGRLKVQTIPFVKEILGLDLLAAHERRRALERGDPEVVDAALAGMAEHFRYPPGSSHS